MPQYARGPVSTNTAESFFALLKRGMVGTFHHVGQQHLDRYVSEVAFRWNCRKVSDEERTLAATKLVEGCRLRYIKVLLKR